MLCSMQCRDVCTPVVVSHLSHAGFPDALIPNYTLPNGFLATREIVRYSRQERPIAGCSG